MPRGRKVSSERMNVSLPTESYATATPLSAGDRFGLRDPIVVAEQCMLSTEFAHQVRLRR